MDSRVYEQHNATAWFAFNISVAVNMLYTALPDIRTVDGAIFTGLALVVGYCAVRSWKLQLREASNG